MVVVEEVFGVVGEAAVPRNAIGRCNLVNSRGKFVMFRADSIDDSDDAGWASVIRNWCRVCFIVVVVVGEGVFSSEVGREGAGVGGEVSAEDGKFCEGKESVEVDFA